MAGDGAEEFGGIKLKTGGFGGIHGAVLDDVSRETRRGFFRVRAEIEPISSSNAFAVVPRSGAPLISQSETALWVTPKRLANSVWLSPTLSRALRIVLPVNMDCFYG